MSTIRPLWLALIAVVTVVLGWAASLLAAANGLPAPVLHVTSLITMAAGTIITLVLGLRVRAYQRQRAEFRDRERRRQAGGVEHARGAARPVEISPVLAARTLVLAQALAYAGAVICGWHGGVLLDLLGAAPFGSSSVTLSLIMIAAAGLMSVVGWVVEQFCKVPPGEDQADGPEGTRGETNGDGQGYAPGAGN
ncbi:DUF3180 domain-containing protein [Zhihengliuella salsuginis]|uniref:DUF3180 domain-containing protein n=1 Tax=Zhihengliuella salsuginis TaxID=578222 RepID=A0ABQ3GMJ7_9MICC|nr:DUF3180 domain-containing protein [Zhihengliuella salsuginis]GHD10771.1 hypothetical protein GCM10008096_24600 [Zhihengliuella salsuginis]